MDLDETLETLARDPTSHFDVAELALLLARDEYPDLDVEACLCELAALAHEAATYVRGDLAARVHGLCRSLFHELGFHGNIKDYYNPRNSYLNQVLEHRTGLPITLSILAMSVGSRAGLDVVGVGLPGHFIAKASEGRQFVLFDPYHGGRQLDPEECEQLVERITGVPFQATIRNLEPLPLGMIAQRMLRNLKATYLSQSDYTRAARVIERLRQLDPRDLLERRDLGIVLIHSGQAGRAIDHLSAYLDAHPNGADATTVNQLVTKAKGDVAKWN